MHVPAAAKAVYKDLLLVDFQNGSCPADDFRGVEVAGDGLCVAMAILLLANPKEAPPTLYDERKAMAMAFCDRLRATAARSAALTRPTTSPPRLRLASACRCSRFQRR